MITDAEFIAAWRSSGGRAKEVADRLGMSLRGTYKRRNKVEGQLGTHLPSAGDTNHAGRGDAGLPAYDYKPRLTIDGFVGKAILFSDAHFWKGIGETIAYRALIEVIKEEKPKIVIGNGDIVDGARISRFPPDGWQNTPRMVDELDEVKDRMSTIRHAYRGARHIRTLGNHCIRFDRYLSQNASDFEGIQGFRLADHLSEWEESVSIFINGHTVVKHRFNGGIHAAYNNTLRAGTNIFTGHTHRLGVTAWGDYRGRRYGCETGALAEIGGPQFSYAEDNPTPGCSGFAVATFDKDGRLLYPELCEVIDGTAYFRGQRVVSVNRGKRIRAAA